MTSPSEEFFKYELAHDLPHMHFAMVYGAIEIPWLRAEITIRHPGVFKAHQGPPQNPWRYWRIILAQMS